MRACWFRIPQASGALPGMKPPRLTPSCRCHALWRRSSPGAWRNWSLPSAAFWRLPPSSATISTSVYSRLRASKTPRNCSAPCILWCTVISWSNALLPTNSATIRCGRSLIRRSAPKRSERCTNASPGHWQQFTPRTSLPLHCTSTVANYGIRLWAATSKRAKEPRRSTPMRRLCMLMSAPLPFWSKSTHCPRR